MMLGQGPRQTTSNLGHMSKPSIQVCYPNPFLSDVYTVSMFYIWKRLFCIFFKLPPIILYWSSLGIDPWVELALLFHSHELQEE